MVPGVFSKKITGIFPIVAGKELIQHFGSLRELISDVYFSHIFLSYGLLLLMLFAYLLNVSVCGPGPFYKRSENYEKKTKLTLAKGEPPPPTKKNCCFSARTSSDRRKQRYFAGIINL